MFGIIKPVIGFRQFLLYGLDRVTSTLPYRYSKSRYGMGANIVRLVCVMVLAVALDGCATKWTKPGATTAEFEGTKASCISRASARFLPHMQHIQIGSGYTTPTQTQCFGTGYNVNCTTSGGQYIPPAFMDIDANNGARNQDVRACFFEAGWTPDK